MSDFDRNYASLRGVGTDRAVAYDMGLRAHMIRVYNLMAAAVALTGVVSWLMFNAATTTNTAGQLVLTSFGQSIYSGPATIVLFLATLGLVFAIGWMIDRLSAGTALPVSYTHLTLPTTPYV